MTGALCPGGICDVLNLGHDALMSNLHPVDLTIIKRALARQQQEVDLLERIGKALYGNRWQTQLAKALGMSDRSNLHNETMGWLAHRAESPGAAARYQFC